MENFAPKGAEPGGAQISTASSHLVNVLFAARLCRPDLLVAITRLANKVSCWQACHNKALRRLMSRIWHHADLELYGSIRTADFPTCEIWLSPDADLNGNMETTKSTSGFSKNHKRKKMLLIHWRWKLTTFVEVNNICSRRPIGARRMPLARVRMTYKMRQCARKCAVKEPEFYRRRTQAKLEYIPPRASRIMHACVYT